MRVLRETFLFAGLLAFWVALSGRFEPLFLGMGVISVAVVTWFASHLIEHTIGSARSHARGSIWRFVLYAGWLTWKVGPSAVQVARIVLDPRLPPRPGIVRFRTELESPAARAMLANSITLIPGTMTLDLDGDELTVHSFTPEAVEDLTSADMQNRIAAVFRDVRQQPPEMVWESGHRPAVPSTPTEPPLEDPALDDPARDDGGSP